MTFRQIEGKPIWFSSFSNPFFSILSLFLSRLFVSALKVSSQMLSEWSYWSRVVVHICTTQYTHLGHNFFLTTKQQLAIRSVHLKMTGSDGSKLIRYQNLEHTALYFKRYILKVSRYILTICFILQKVVISKAFL